MAHIGELPYVPRASRPAASQHCPVRPSPLRTAATACEQPRRTPSPRALQAFDVAAPSLADFSADSANSTPEYGLHTLQGAPWGGSVPMACNVAAQAVPVAASSDPRARPSISNPFEPIGPSSLYVGPTNVHLPEGVFMIVQVQLRDEFRRAFDTTQASGSTQALGSTRAFGSPPPLVPLVASGVSPGLGRGKEAVNEPGPSTVSQMPGPSGRKTAAVSGQVPKQDANINWRLNPVGTLISAGSKFPPTVVPVDCRGYYVDPDGSFRDAVAHGSSHLIG